MSKHTLGPWVVDDDGFTITSEEHSNIVIAELLAGSLQHVGELRANARLIAAAPELLEVLKGLIDTSQATPTEWVRACSNAAAAIAKAEGRK